MKFAIKTLAKFNKQAIKKYHKGQKEHGGTFQTKPGMMCNILNEITDQVFYYAAIEYQLKAILKCLQQDKPKAAILLLENLLSQEAD